jgi:antitoxin (DNA-binding transcriptional repressor) of toxin-antitoxin stability system
MPCSITWLAILVKVRDHSDMSATVSIGKAKLKLCDLVEQARQGQTHIIIVHDQPCAQLGPVRFPARALTEEWRQRVKRIRLNRPWQKRLSLPKLIREGRK